MYSLRLCGLIFSFLCQMAEIKTIGICGAGSMGSGIAQVFAQADFKVLLYEINEIALEKAKAGIEKNLSQAVEKNKLTEAQKANALANISYETKLENIKADLIIEAIVEKIEIKKELFATLAKNNSNETILATNTSSLSVTEIAQDIPNPNRVAGLHFFNPAHLMRLVEVIRGAQTSEETMNSLKSIVEKIGKSAVISKDSPGFIVNRVARHYYVESLKILEEGAAKKETVDALLESAGFKMGAFKLMDFVGHDINFAVTKSLFEAFHGEPRFRPSRLQQQLVLSKNLGKKTGKGFYEYKD